MKKLLLALCMTWAAQSYGTTWVESEVDDPIKKNQKCKVNNPASYGGYIYNWPSKYDQVFWPHTDFHSLWFCEKSGYASFMTDFGDLSESDKKKISEFLKNHRLNDPSKSELISVLESLYEIRELSNVRKNELKRVFARWYQKFGDLEKATNYRKEAYKEIDIALEGELPQETRLEYLYVSANYARLFGNQKKSDKRLSELQAEIRKVKDTELSGYGEYLSELAKETKFIVPGQKIEPVVPSKNK